MINLTVFKIGGVLLGKPEVVKQVPIRAFDFAETEKVLFVCSAVAGVTKELTLLSEFARNGQKKKRDISFDNLKQKHLRLGSEVLQSHKISNFKDEVEIIFSELRKDLIKRRLYPARIISYGETLSCVLFSMVLDDYKVANFRFDARECVRTFGPVEYAQLNIQKSVKRINDLMPSKFSSVNALVTEGFIGQDHNNLLTSILPRNGSDLSAALFAHALSAKQIVYLKDTPGVLKDTNGDWEDPNNIYFDLSYSEYLKLFKGKASYPVYPEAIELLKTSNIPARISPFYVDFKGSGTEIKA